MIKLSIYIACLSIFCSCTCQQHIDGSTRPLDPVYDDYNSGYWKQVQANQFPTKYSMDEQLLLIAHGFDTNVRAGFAGNLWDEIKNSENQRQQLAAFLESDNPALAWAAAWTIEKSSNIQSLHDYKAIYQRADVIAFELRFHQ